MIHRDIQVGDIWKWLSRDSAKDELWLVTEAPNKDHQWMALCLQGPYVGEYDEITADDSSVAWIKVA